MAMITKILIITNLIQRMMIVILAMMMSRSNNSLLPILMILILNQMMNIPIRTLNSMILGYYCGFLSISGVFEPSKKKLKKALRDRSNRSGPYNIWFYY